MFVHQTRLPHVLPPRLYVCPEQYARELEKLFRPAWHVVAGIEDLASDGDFLSLELLGVPLLVRNFGGELHAFLNVCTHRHCLLTHLPCGNQPKLVCQYHGWEYCADGSTTRIPDAGSFRPLPGGPERLRKFAIRVRGPLVFVSLAESPVPLEDLLGPLSEPCDEHPAERWRLSAAWSYRLDVNWKVPVENTIESYHVPLVHPQTLVKYTDEDATTHELFSTGTVMRSLSVTPLVYRLLARLVLPRLDPSSSIEQYRLFHGFPHLFLIRTDATLQVMTVLPTSPTACQMAVRLYTLRAARETWVSRLCTWFWGRLKSYVVKMILAEDIRLLPDIQRGMQHSPFQGTISMREELVFAFQDYVRRQCGLPVDESVSPPSTTPSTTPF
ncbi:MAG TPA: aromatic ring-hydroxylating dioxygenase subunit alpha [Pirellulales bacterium]|jgi:phenylpropionate dioxygenase-like ring-hydroxylating dioxygenase large terminal subunit|nr:aromatic ring-hydroxylating dioxygenase subunit alpha [Pirellulales bacterium]